MAETASHETELTRAETAEFLRSIADELDADKDRIRVAIGNKRVRLSPPERIATYTAGCNITEEFATPGWRISPRTYSRQY